MKRFLFLVLTLFCMEVTMTAQSQNKILVAYFSWSRNAKVLADQIAEATGGDLFEIKTEAAR
ncbi:MAG: hypothetical protein LBB98_07310 [Treponema sp.]|jgi:hypothetical protein|nr:hypothetical protein [Treponema sp.]